MNDAENRLKEKEYLVMSASKQSSSSSRISGTSGLIGSKDIFVSNEEESVDSDLSMRGKVFHRWIGEEKEEETVEEDYEEDEDDKYYENKIFEKKDCDIILESSEDSNEAVNAQQEEEEVIIDSSEDEETSNIQKMNFSWAAVATKTIDDEEIARLIEEETIETASTLVNFNEDEELSVEEIDQNISMEINIETPSGSPPIEIEDSPSEEKPSAEMLFSKESLAEAQDDVIEIESDEEKPEKEEADIPAGKILFSSMFSSQQEVEEVEEVEDYSEDDQPDKPADVESDLPGNL